MPTCRIHPIVMGAKVFDKGMMTYRHGYGREYVIPPGVHVNAYEAYDIMMKVKRPADILMPLHEPRFASMDTIP